MAKIYGSVLLLLCSLSAFGQFNRFLVRVFTAPDSAQILDYNLGTALTYKKNGNDYTYNLVSVGSGVSRPVPYHGGFSRDTTTVFPARPNVWVGIASVLIQGEQQIPGKPGAPLYEYITDGQRFTQLDDTASMVSNAGSYTAWYSQNGDHSGLMFRGPGVLAQQPMVDSVIYGLAVERTGLLVYSTGRSLYTYNRGVTTLIDQLPAADSSYFHSITTDGGLVGYLSYEKGIGTKVHLHAINSPFPSPIVLFTEGDTGGHSDIPMELAQPLVNGFLAGIHFTSPYSNNTQGYVYTRFGNLPDSIPRKVLPIKSGTDVSLARMEGLNTQGDIAVRAKGNGKQGIYIISRDGSYNKRVSDSADGVWNDRSNWLLAVGSNLYDIVLDTAVLHYANPIFKNGYARNRTPIPASDFIFNTGVIDRDTSNKYALQYVQIVKRPAHGVLIDKNNQPIYNNDIIARADLDTLKYSAGIFPGKDTISWRAFDGVAWTNVAPVYLTLAQPPDTLKPFERNTLESTPIRFWSRQFKEHFFGTLKGIRISRLPAYGKLTIHGQQVFYERSRDLTLEEIDSMYYTPYPGIVGVDTLQWMAYNGTAYSKNDTPVILRVYPNLNTPPILRTLESSYNQSAPPDTIFIANYPRPEAHTDVLVWIDSMLVAVEANKTFILDPSQYIPGIHQLKVQFRHKLDSISINRNFTITAPLMVSLKRSYSMEDPFTVFPNPFAAQLTINGLSWKKDYILRLYDAQGKLVLVDRSFGQNRKVLELSNGVKGVYYLQVYDTESKSVIKIIKLLHL